MNKEQLKKIVGQRIVALRSQKGWSQSDLARACNKDRQALEKLENGKVNPTIYSLLEIAKALDVPLKVIVFLLFQMLQAVWRRILVHTFGCRSFGSVIGAIAHQLHV